MNRNDSGAYIGWGIAFLIFAGLCFQIRSCVMDLQNPKQVVEKQPKMITFIEQQSYVEPCTGISTNSSIMRSYEEGTPKPTPYPLPTKCPEETSKEVPKLIQPSVKLIDNNVYRVIVGKQTEFFDTQLPVRYNRTVSWDCDPVRAQVEVSVGGKKQFYDCGGLPYRFKQLRFSEADGFEPSFSSTIKVRIFDETKADHVTFNFWIE